MSTPNWPNLVMNGRAKAIGVPWTEEEAGARAKGIPAEFVRDGILTLEEYEKAKAKDAKDGAPLERKPRKELEAIAKKEGVNFTPDATDEALVKVLKPKKGKKK